MRNMRGMKRTQMVLRGILAAAFAMAFTACASLSEPGGTNQTLVVGSANIQRGTVAYSMGAQIFLRELNGAGTHTLVPGAGGLFHSTRIQPGAYRVERIMYRTAQGRLNILHWRDGPIIEIENAAVNNLGVISAHFPVGSRYWFPTVNQGYEQTWDLFQQRHGSSSWNDMPWVNIGFNSANTPVAAQAEPAAQPPPVAEPVPPQGGLVAPVLPMPPPPVEY